MEARLTTLCYNFPTMGRKKTKAPERPVFDAIRKPTAPQGRKIGTEKPEEVIHPTLRKAKHKKRIEELNNRDDV